MHLRVSSPPIVSPCFYGIDMASPEQLIAAGRDIDEVRARIGADSLAYLSLEGLQMAIRRPAAGFCRACLTGEYPSRRERRSRQGAVRDERRQVNDGRR